MTLSSTERLPASPIRICHLITDLDTGGTERNLVNLITKLDPARFASEVVSLLEPGPMAKPLAQAGISVTSLGMRRGRPTFHAAMTLVRHLRATKPQVLQTWLYHADLLGTAAACVWPHARLAWNVRCSDITRLESGRPIRWLIRLLAALSRCPDAIVINSERGRRDHEALGYHPKAWINIPNGVDLRRFRPRRQDRPVLCERLGLDPTATTIGFVARFHPMKDIETFLRAAALFAQSHADVEFVLCGSGFSRENTALTAMIGALGLGLDKRVFLLGEKPHIEDVYPAFDILALCSITEGFPNVLCEAMACGVPCVATDVGDSADIISDCGLVVPVRSPEALAQAWHTLMGLGPEAIGELARARMSAHYGLDRMRERYQSFYQSLVTVDQAAPLV